MEIKCPMCSKKFLGPSRGRADCPVCGSNVSVKWAKKLEESEKEREEFWWGKLQQAFVEEHEKVKTYWASEKGQRVRRRQSGL